jgi:hypothetical protein
MICRPNGPKNLQPAITAQGGTSMAVAADVTDRAAVDRMVMDVTTRLGPVDVLVNNAGVPADGLDLGLFVDSTTAEWEPLINLNLYAVLHCSQAVLPGMIARRTGRLVHIVSDAGRVGEARIAVYSAAKGGGNRILAIAGEGSRAIRGDLELHLSGRDRGRFDRRARTGSTNSSVSHGAGWRRRRRRPPPSSGWRRLKPVG